MTPVTFVVPGPLATRTGGSIYDRRLVEGLRALGHVVTVVELDPVGHPLAPPLDAARAAFATLPDGAVVLADGLVYGTVPEIIEAEAWRLRFVPIIHMPLARTPGLSPGEAGWLSNMERRALVRARHVVVTGTRTRSILGAGSDAGLAVPITRIPPGCDRADTGEGHAPASPLRLLCVANLTTGKGHDILLRALAAAPTRDWILACAGSPAREAATARRLETLAGELDIASRVEWLGELDDAALARAYADADLFVLATRGETYGMAVADAIARGLPVVSTRTGEIVALAGDGARLAEPGDAAGFAAALAVVLADATLRGRLAAGARRAALQLPTWDEAAAAMAGVIQKVVTNG